MVKLDPKRFLDAQRRTVGVPLCIEQENGNHPRSTPMISLLHKAMSRGLTDEEKFLLFANFLFAQYGYQPSGHYVWCAALSQIPSELKDAVKAFYTEVEHPVVKFGFELTALKDAHHPLRMLFDLKLYGHDPRKLKQIYHAASCFGKHKETTYGPYESFPWSGRPPVMALFDDIVQEVADCKTIFIPSDDSKYHRAGYPAMTRCYLDLVSSDEFGVLRQFLDHVGYRRNTKFVELIPHWKEFCKFVADFYRNIPEVGQNQRGHREFNPVVYKWLTENPPSEAMCEALETPIAVLLNDEFEDLPVPGTSLAEFFFFYRERCAPQAP